jgi:hypothetical protein
MSKKKARQQPRHNKSQRQSRHKWKTMVITGLILCFGLTGMIMAQWRATRVAGSTTTMLASSAPLPTPTPTPLTLSKEYIYAGGRLIATEEPEAAATPTPTPNPRINVALASNGGTATASSFSLGYSPAGAINGDQKGLNGGQDGYWSSNTAGFPAWLEVAFNGMKAIDEIDLFTVQDNYANPVTPTDTMTFSLYGLTGFDLQYWTGSAWASVPGASVTSNNLVSRKFTFPALATTKVRVLTNASIDNYSRIAELEAWSSTAPAQTNFARSAITTVSASSSYTGYAASGAVNGDRKGLNGDQDGYWSTSSAGFPAWLEVNFNTSRTLREIDLFTIQDSYWAPSEPTPSMTFTYYGLTNFTVQYWTGTSWAAVPGASMTDNNLVWKKFTFTPLATSKIRVWVTGSADNWSRIAELEAWGD